ncbi:response regulator [Clostridiaceae bacterium 35-E11]
MEKVLIIEDNEQNCEIMKDVVTAWGYKVYTAFQGLEGFDVACSCKPDVILLDVMLPGMNGFEVCKKLKADELTQNIPVIMLTALNEVEDRIRGFNVGADVFLSKPIIYQELKNRLAWAIHCRNKFRNMEYIDQLVKSFLKMMEYKDVKLYKHACNVKKYCEKVGKILFIKEEEMERLVIGAYLHDIGKIVSDSFDDHVESGVEIVTPLKIYLWLKPYIRNHHEKMNGQGFPDGLMDHEMSFELKILITMNRFIEWVEVLENEEQSIMKLKEECKKNYWSTEVLEALKQVLEDEKFKEKMTGLSLKDGRNEA